MQSLRRARRLRVLAAVLLGVSGLALAGCRSAPTVAVYIGNRTVTEAEVDKIIADATSAATDEPGTHAPARPEVVTAVMIDALCAHTSLPTLAGQQTVTPEMVKQADRVPAASEFAKIRARLYNCLGSIPVANAPAPSEAELREIFDDALAQNMIKPGTTFDQAKTEIANVPDVRVAVAQRAFVAQLMNREHVTVNPRYRPIDLHFFVNGDKRLVGLNFGGPASDVVADTAADTR